MCSNVAYRLRSVHILLQCQQRNKNSAIVFLAHGALPVAAAAAAKLIATVAVAVPWSFFLHHQLSTVLFWVFQITLSLCCRGWRELHEMQVLFCSVLLRDKINAVYLYTFTCL